MKTETPKQVPPVPRPPLPDVMGETAACRYLDCSPAMLGRLRRAGEIRSFLVGRSRKYSGPSLSDYVKRQVEKAERGEEQ